MCNLGMKLHSPNFLCWVFNHCHRRFWRAGCCNETTRQFRHGIEVAHPHTELGWNAFVQQLRCCPRDALQLCAAIFAAPAAGDDPAQLLSNQLGAVTNAQNRNAQLKDFTIKNRGTFDMHACWPARQNDGDWLAGSNLAGRNAVRNDFGIHLRFTYPTGNQLGILRTKINH